VSWFPDVVLVPSRGPAAAGRADPGNARLSLPSL